MNDMMVPRSARDMPTHRELRKRWMDRNWFKLWVGGRGRAQRA
jgi:hypothetical protein